MVPAVALLKSAAVPVLFPLVAQSSSRPAKVRSVRLAVLSTLLAVPMAAGRLWLAELARPM
jgi:hypothetical protein